MYIYGLFDEFGEIRYIGKTEGNLRSRLADHLCPSKLNKRTHKAHWLSSVLARGGKPTIKLIQEMYREEDLDPAEVFWIAYFRAAGCRLTNISDGGGSGMKGKTHSPEARAKLSAANKGRKLTPEHCALISLNAIERHKNPEFREKRSKISKAKWADPEFRKKMEPVLALKRGRPLGPHTAEAKEKIAASKRGVKRDPEVMARSVLGKKKNREIKKRAKLLSDLNWLLGID